MKKRRWLSFLLTAALLLSTMSFSAATVSADDGTVEVSTWEELKRALEYTTKCSVVKVVADIETKSLNGHTGLHQDNIIFMSMAMDKVLDLNGHTVNAYAKYYSEVAQGYLINICDKDARLTIRDSVGGGALISAENIAKMKDGVCVINTSRGTNVDEAALLAALEAGKVRAAGLDVYADEPATNKALYSHPMVSCTPHIGAATNEAQKRIGAEIVDIIKAM